MSKSRWEQIKEVLEIARDLAAAERDDYLNRACLGDEELRLEVDSLLAANLDHVAFLEAPPVRLVDSYPSALGSQVGAYRIIRELGHGGMGVVYLAARSDEEFEGQVAVKVLRPVGAIPEIEWRFRQEIQILANLNHPNIAKLYEAGRTEDRRPYFIMEYVEGLPVTQFCREQNLSIAERLRLFQKICGAVQYAHQSLIVHRDLKPRNILVTVEGEPKLLDFGIAKLLQTDGNSGASTITQVRFFTRDYASPEQVSGGQITTASDVYSLGVILYEFLSGQLPCRLKSHAEEEIRRIICEEEPESPSVAVVQGFRSDSSHEISTGEAVRNDQGGDPRKLRRQLQGDLDKIALMALRKEPSRRYRSVEQMAGDIDAHFQGFPVLARGASWKYRATKFLRRNRLAATLTATVVLLSVGFGVLMALQQRQTARELDRAQQVSDFMKSVFLLVDPGNSKASETSAKQILDRAAQLLVSDKERDPRIRAELLNTISTIYTHLGLYDAALPLAEEALKVVRSKGGSEEDLGSMLNQLAIIRHHQGNFAEAEAMYRRVLDILRSSLGPSDPKIAKGLNDLGALLLEMGRYDESEDLLRQSLALRRTLFPRDHPQMSESLNNLAAVLVKQGRLSEAETLFREVLRLRQQLHKNPHPELGLAFHNLGWALSEQRKYREAKEYYRLGLQQDRAVYDQDHPSAASTLNNLANTCIELGQYDEATAAAQEAVAIYRRTFGENHRRTAQGYFTLAKIFLLQGNLPQAEALASKALDIRRVSLQASHPDIAYSLSQLGDILEERGNFASAESFHRQSLEIRKQNWKKDHPGMVNGLERLGLFLLRQDRSNEAEPLFQEALSMASRLYDQTHPDIAELKKALAAVECTNPDRAKDGEVLAEQAVVKLREAFPPGHWRIADAEAVWGSCLARQNRYAEAEPHLRKAAEDLIKARGRSAAIAQRAIRRLVKLHEDWEKPTAAAKYRGLLSSQ
jgi:eukaryotic-like serine/threonine-protein kinase